MIIALRPPVDPLAFCALHGVWQQDRPCAHCQALALIGELREQIGILEARIADIEERHIADRRAERQTCGDHG